MVAAGRSSPFADRGDRTAAGTFGLGLFLASLGILFAVVLIGYLVIRFAPSEQPVEIPPLPGKLWLSTLLLVAGSGTIHAALRAARRDRPRRLRAATAATALLGFGFLGVQTLCWLEWAGALAQSLGEAQRAFLLSGFYVLTGVHAVHVLGGLVPMTVVAARAFRGRYSSTDHAGVLYCAIYWHFLDAVWLVLFATLLLST